MDRVAAGAAELGEGTATMAAVQFDKGDEPDGRLPVEAHEVSRVRPLDIDPAAQVNAGLSGQLRSARGQLGFLLLLLSGHVLRKGRTLPLLPLLL